MKLFFFGKSGSGKSTLIEEVLKCKSFEYLAIDTYRSRYCNGNWDGFFQANKAMIKDIDPSSNNQLIECVGTGYIGEALSHALIQITDDVRIVIVKARINTCISRSRNRPWYVMNLPPGAVNNIERSLQDPHTYSKLRSMYMKYNVLEVFNNNRFEKEHALFSILKFI